MKYPRLLTRVFNTPLALSPDKAAVIAGVLTAWRDDDETETVAVWEMEKGGTTNSAPGIAVIEVCGTLVAKSSWLNAASGLTSYEDINHAVAAAEADASVRGVLLLVDSPGGEVCGMFECATVLAECSKPLVAVAAFDACSAACVLMVQADEIFVSDSSVAGSIGVIAQHMESSARDAAEGFKYTTIFAGARKNDGNPHEPLSKDAAAAIRADIEAVNDRLIARVAAARGLTEDAVRGFEAGIFRAEAIIDAGLADQMGGVEAALASLSARINSSVAISATRSTKETVMSKTVAEKPIAADLKAKATDAELEEEEKAKAKAEDTEEDEDPETQQKPVSAMTADDCKEISALCTIAGVPTKAASYITAGATVAQVRNELIAAAATNQTTKTGVMPTDGTTAKTNIYDPKSNPLLADAQRRAAAARKGGMNA